MNKVLLGLSVFLLGSQAQALHYFNCSNADTSVKVVEEEIWGANPVGCFYEGEPIKDAKITLLKKSKHVMESDKKGTSRDWTETFAIKATVEGSNLPLSKKIMETIFVCKEVSTSAVDLVAGTPPCEIEEK